MGNIKKKITIRRYDSWTKWGGARQGLRREFYNEEWNCQACGERQSITLPRYYIIDDREGIIEFLKICSSCKWRVLKEQIRNYLDLVEKVRKPNTDIKTIEIQGTLSYII